MGLGYRPIKLKSGWTKHLTTKGLIEAVEQYLFDFAKTSAFDSGRRLSETEAYLQGLYDAKRLVKNHDKTKR